VNVLELTTNARCWIDAGLPRVLPIDRQVWAALVLNGPQTVTSISEQVWGDSFNRKSARASLARLAILGLASQEGSRWVSRSTHPQGQTESIDSPQGRSSESIDSPQGRSSESIDSPQGRSSESIDSPQGRSSESIDSPQGRSSESIDSPNLSQSTHPQGQTESIDSPNLSQSTHPQGQTESIDSPRKRRAPTERARASRTPAAARSLEERDERDDVFKEEKKNISLPLPPLSGRSQLATIPGRWDSWCPLEIAEAEQLDAEGIPPPGPERQEWLSFAASCATWSAIRRRPPGAIAAPLSYRDKCLRSLADQVDAARSAILDALDLARSIRGREAKQALVEETRATAISQASAPTLPPYDPELDDPELDPESWLLGRTLTESEGLRDLRAAGDLPWLAEVQRRSATLSRMTKADWARQLKRELKPKALRAVADRAREKYLVEVSRLLAAADDAALGAQ